MEKEDPLRLETWALDQCRIHLALKLIKEVSKRNMHIIFDGVFIILVRKVFAFKDVEIEPSMIALCRLVLSSKVGV